MRRLRPSTILFAAAVTLMLAGAWLAHFWRPLRVEDLGGSAAIQVGEKVDLNTADAATLGLLPGIGPGLSERIIERRERVGRFARVEDLDAVSGISARTIEKIRPWVVCGGTDSRSGGE